MGERCATFGELLAHILVKPANFPSGQGFLGFFEKARIQHRKKVKNPTRRPDSSEVNHQSGIVDLKSEIQIINGPLLICFPECRSSTVL